MVKVEIERTSTPYGVPKTKQSKQGTVHRPSLLDSGATNGHTTSSTKPITDSAFQPYVPVLKSNKRKREPPGDLQDEFSKPTDTTIAAVAASGQRQYPRPVAEQEEDRDLKKARRREKKERKEREAGVGKANGVESHEKDKSTPLETKRKRKKEKTDDPKSHDVDVDALTSSKSTEGLDISQREGKQEKKKKREGKDVVSITELNEQSQQAEMDGVTEHGVGKKKSQSREMADGGIKGGVESIDDDASEHSKLSADQDKQPPPKFNVTSDNDWLRAKTSRVLDLMDESLPNSASVFPETQEQSDETPTAQEVENVERPATSAEGPNIGLVPTSLPSIGRLFVRNLPYTANESDIQGLFSKYGRLDEVRLAQNSLSFFP